jgi:hypothetical protein
VLLLLLGFFCVIATSHAYSPIRFCGFLSGLLQFNIQDKRPYLRLDEPASPAVSIAFPSPSWSSTSPPWPIQPASLSSCLAMLLPVLGLLYFLVFAPQSAFSLFQFVTYSGVSQCGNFNVSFSGGKRPAALPLTLTVLPFNSTPLAFVVPNSVWDNSTGSGSFVTPLPIPAGVALLASLDDAAGNSAALISEVIQVQPSADASCLSSNTAAPAPFQLVTGAVSQCLPFSVSRNTSSVNHPISTRGFIPTSLSFKLKWTAYHATQGVDTFTFIMKVAQGLQVALLFDDGQGNRRVSDLLLVQGDRSSPSGCLQPGSAQSTSAAADGSQRLSRSAIFGDHSRFYQTDSLSLDLQS